MNEKIIDGINRLTNHSHVFYAVMLIVLIGVQVNFFNNAYFTDHIIWIIITLNAIPLSSFLIKKMSERNLPSKPKSEPSNVCIACNGKMITTGNWKCIDCGGVFRHGKKERL